VTRSPETSVRERLLGRLELDLLPAGDRDGGQDDVEHARFGTKAPGDLGEELRFHRRAKVVRPKRLGNPLGIHVGCYYVVSRERQHRVDRSLRRREDFDLAVSRREITQRCRSQ
jgi:hypothetical protein